jgi:hypothetical protein
LIQRKGIWSKAMSVLHLSLFLAMNRFSDRRNALRPMVHPSEFLHSKQGFLRIRFVPVISEGQKDVDTLNQLFIINNFNLLQ